MELHIQKKDTPLLLSVSPYFLELRYGAKPKTLKIQRKTKAGLWETIFIINNIVDFNTAAYTGKAGIIINQGITSKNFGLRIITASERQIYSSYYSKFYQILIDLILAQQTFGISINKTEDYILCSFSKFNNQLFDTTIKNISNYFSSLSRKHRGIRRFDFAKEVPEDNYLKWGWMVFYDNYKISVAFDTNLILYTQNKQQYNNIIF